MKVGDKVTWHGSESRYGGENWVRKGMVGHIVEVHPDVPATGLTIGHDADGNPIIDSGLNGYAVIQFPNGSRRAIDLS